MPAGDVFSRVVTVEGLEAIPDLFGDVFGNAADGAIALEKATANIQGNIRTVDHPPQGQQEAGHYLFAVIGDKHLVAVELDAALGDVDVGLELGEVENAVDHKGVIGVEVNPQQGVFLEGVEVAVKLQIVLVAEATGGLLPGGFVFVDHLPIQLDGYRHEVAVGFNQLANPGRLQVFLLPLHQGKGDGGTDGAAIAGAQFKFGGAGARPVHRRCPFLVGQTIDLHLSRHHKGGVEPQTKVADNRVGGGTVFILGDKFFSAGEGHLVDVLLHLLGGHANAGIGDGQGLFMLI